MKNMNMKDLGFTDRFACQAAEYNDLFVGRVISQYKNMYSVFTENGKLMAEISGRLRYNTTILSEYPAVGDFVMVDRTDNRGGNGIIHHILSRKSAFIRKAAGTSNDEQVVASNIDTVFICMSLNKDFNLRRIERYLSIAWDSGASPVIVLTKSDLCDDLDDKLVEIQSVALGVEVIATSSVSQDGFSRLKDYIKCGKTVAFIGSSGVGKSTIINKFIGKDILETAGIREEDSKGRHTTTRREMFLLDDGGIVIDTPGMREIGIEHSDISKAFLDINELSKECKFSDCTHTNEPKCAVREAINRGLFTEERLASYNKLMKESKYEGLNSKQIEVEKLNSMFKDLGGMKSGKKLMKKMKNSKV